MILAFAALGAAAIQLVGEHMYSQDGNAHVATLKFAARELNETLQNEDYKKLFTESDILSSTYDARIVIIDEGGNVILDTLSLLTGHTLDLKTLLSTESFQHRQNRNAGKLAEGMDCKNVCISAVALNGGYFLYGIFSADHVPAELNSLALQLLYAALAVLALAVVMGFFITRSYTKPVKELSDAIGKLSAGDFSVRVSEEGNNEFTDLSRAFNEMTSRMEMLDRSRNQFVSNASHELKTPLATIKIMVQTLLFQEVYDESMSKEFLGDVDKEVDRLSAVVSDLLTLVGMDSGESKLNMEEFSLSDMLTEDAKRLSPLSRERGIEMELNITGNIELCGDRIKLDQVFYNLIDNAIKYTPRGEGVSVELIKQNKNAVVRIKDNGIGIPEEDQKHIFDRFYRVDKARSRETGGTGLGLSIAKQIILAHNGTINVTSKVDEGSVFTVTLPLNQRSNGRLNA